MKLSILEIFVVFWTSTILWVLVEYFYYRYSKNHKNPSIMDRYRED